MKKPEDLGSRSFGPGFEEFIERQRARDPKSGEYLEDQMVVVESARVRSIRYVVDRKTMESRDAAPALIAACGIPAADKMLDDVEGVLQNLVAAMGEATEAVDADDRLGVAIEKLHEAIAALPTSFCELPDPDPIALSIADAIQAIEARRAAFTPSAADRKRRAAIAPLRDAAAVELAAIHRRYAIASKRSAVDAFVKAALVVVGFEPIKLRDKSGRLTPFGRKIH